MSDPDVERATKLFELVYQRVDCDGEIDCYNWEVSIQEITEALRAVRAEEREACARAVEQYQMIVEREDWEDWWNDDIRKIADAIRRKGEG